VKLPKTTVQIAHHEGRSARRIKISEELTQTISEVLISYGIRTQRLA